MTTPDIGFLSSSILSTLILLSSLCVQQCIYISAFRVCCWRDCTLWTRLRIRMCVPGQILLLSYAYVKIYCIFLPVFVCFSYRENGHKRNPPLPCTPSYKGCLCIIMLDLLAPPVHSCGGTSLQLATEERTDGQTDRMIGLKLKVMTSEMSCTHTQGVYPGYMGPSSGWTPSMSVVQ